MLYQTKTLDNTIRGSCSHYVCRCCFTKFGWKHQEWCENNSVTEPTCSDCRYFSEHAKRCIHPGKKQKEREKPYEKAEHTL